MSEIDDLNEELEEERDPEADLMETEVIKIRDPEDGLTRTTAIKISDIEEEPEAKPEKPARTGGSKKPRRKLKPAARAFLYVVLIVSLFVCAYSGVQLYLGNRTYREGMDAYAELADEENTVTETAEDEQGEVLEYRPANFEALAKINPDVVGWITLDGTHIDYPIVQGPDNEFYLEHLFSKKTNHTGCVFIDVNNHPDFSDPNSILYAHHMRNGSMFSDLEGYRKEGFLEEHPYFILQTLDSVYKIEPFADILGDAYSTYNQTAFENDAEFLSFIEQIRNESTFRTDAVITASDRVVILSTCRYDVSEGRYAVVGKLTKIK